MIRQLFTRIVNGKTEGLPPMLYEVHHVVTEQPKDPTVRHIGALAHVTFSKEAAILMARADEAELRKKNKPFRAVVAERRTDLGQITERQEQEAYRRFIAAAHLRVPKRDDAFEFNVLKAQWEQTRSDCGCCGLYKRYKDLGDADSEVGGYQVCHDCHAKFKADPAFLAAYRERITREQYDGYALNGWLVDFDDRNEWGYVRFNQEDWDRRYHYPVHLRDGKGLITSGTTEMQFPDGRWAAWRHDKEPNGAAYITADIGKWDEPIPGEQWWVRLHREPWHHEPPPPDYTVVWPSEEVGQ